MDSNDMIYSTRYDFNKSCIILNNNEFEIYAHPNELLHEHSYKTWIIFKELLDESVLTSFYSFFNKKNYLDMNKDEFLDILKVFIYYHDIGKVSFSFQIKKLTKKDTEDRTRRYSQLKSIYGDLTNNLLNMDSKHSFYGYYLFMNYVLHHYNIENNPILLLLSYCILGHHTKIKEINLENLEKKVPTMVCLNNFIFNQEHYLKTNNEFKENISNIDNHINQLNKLLNENKTNNSMFSCFYQYIYSLLISADALATSQYDKNEIDKSSINNRIDSKLRKRMLDKYYSCEINENINEGIYNKIDNKTNRLRHNMLIEASTNLIKCIENNPSQHTFYLNMPTGGGKTNTSMKLALDILEHTTANRIIYAMPYINIIDQNYEIIKDNWDLVNNEEIRNICSTNSFIFDNKNEDDMGDILINDDFFNYPVMCTTFVRLFDVLLNTKKKSKYALSSLANSIIILDEVQSLPIKNWTSLTYILDSITKNYNIYFILMSATLPKFDKLLLENNDSNNYKINCEYLIKNPSIYFNHDIFLKRNEIKDKIREFSLTDTENKKELVKYLSKVIEENFNQEHTHGLIVLNTVKSSKIIYEIIENLREYFKLEVDILNSTTLKYKKRELIEKIDNLKPKERYILVSTQSIEAGIDVSFDFVIRDFATIDSIEQVRGRCNRGNTDKKGNIYLIKLKMNNKTTYEIIYNEDELKTRIITSEELFKDKTNLNYDFNDLKKYYDNISCKINEKEISKDNTDEKSDFKNIERWNTIKYSEFKEKSGIKIIDDRNEIAFYIEENISEENLEKYFDKNEIKFLKEKNLIKNNAINSIDILECYLDEIKEIEKNQYIKYKIITKQYGSIMSNFIINTYRNEALLEEYKNSESYHTYKDKFYFYIILNELIGDDESKMYSLNSGLNKSFKYREDILTNRFM